MPPAIQSADGKHLGFVPVYRWTDLAGDVRIQHGNIYRTEAEARAAAHSPKPASWLSYTVEVNRCATFFEAGPVVRSDRTIWELVCGDDEGRAAA